MESSDPEVLTSLTVRVMVPPWVDVLDFDVTVTVGSVRARGVATRVTGRLARSVVRTIVVPWARAPEPRSA